MGLWIPLRSSKDSPLDLPRSSSMTRWVGAGLVMTLFGAPILFREEFGCNDIFGIRGGFVCLRGVLVCYGKLMRFPREFMAPESKNPEMTPAKEIVDPKNPAMTPVCRNRGESKNPATTPAINLYARKKREPSRKHKEK